MKVYEEYNECTLCPRNCRVNRNEGQKGFCKMPSSSVVNLIMHHFGEEPVISGTNPELERGSGTVFFEGCTLRCAFCQNHEISNSETARGQIMDASELAANYLRLQDEGVYNINLVTASHFAPVIIDSLKIAKNNGLHIPVVYNCSGFEKVETIKKLEGLVDVYLPDMKFCGSQLAGEISSAPDYFEIAKLALEEMVRQTGEIRINDEGIMEKGVIVRHLMLPGELFDTRKILDYLLDNYGNRIYISLMCQYTPCEEYINSNKNLSDSLRKKLLGTLNMKHYEAMADYLYGLGQENAFIQEEQSKGNTFLPDFNV
ncbi:MAG: radical SAM protein [Clostridia bacterium]|nr:radical SAM protein [Clostridia bacterium]